jgi:hypothetical protein
MVHPFDMTEEDFRSYDMRMRQRIGENLIKGKGEPIKPNTLLEDGTLCYSVDVRSSILEIKSRQKFLELPGPSKTQLKCLTDYVFKNSKLTDIIGGHEKSIDLLE